MDGCSSEILSSSASHACALVFIALCLFMATVKAEKAMAAAPTCFAPEAFQMFVTEPQAGPGVRAAASETVVCLSSRD